MIFYVFLVRLSKYIGKLNVIVIQATLRIIKSTSYKNIKNHKQSASFSVLKNYKLQEFLIVSTTVSKSSFSKEASNKQSRLAAVLIAMGP